MAFNVCDNKGEHLGVLVRPFSMYTNIFLMAITRLKIEDIGFDIDKAEETLAGLYMCKTLTGKVNKEKLQRVFSELKKTEYARFLDAEYEEILKLCLINNGIEVEKYYSISIDGNNTDGYILIDANKMNMDHGRLILEDNIEYTRNQETACKDIPLYARIVDYPQEFIRIPSYFDIGGKVIGRTVTWDHYHSTELKIQSGNMVHDLDLPLTMHCKKDTNIQLFYKEKALHKVFYDGIFYSFKGI